MPLINYHDTIPYPASNRLPKSSVKKQLARSPAKASKPIVRSPAKASKPIVRSPSKASKPLARSHAKASKPIVRLPAKPSKPIVRLPAKASKPIVRSPSKKAPPKKKPIEMPVGSIELVRTHAIEMPSSQEKLKHIDVVRAVHRRHLSGEQNPHERPRKIREKPYVSLFMKMHGGGKKYKSIQQGDIDPNELQIKINIPEGSDVNRFELGLHFDHLDDVRTIIITDKGFYDGLFYTEVIKTERYKEAWQIMRQRYLLDSWIDKYIYFLLHAPSILPILMG